MKATSMKPCFAVLFLSLLVQAQAQDTRIFNQNASRSRLAATDQWVFGINSGYSFGPNSSERTLFRGSSIATKMSAAYYFGRIGLNFSSGIAPGSFSDKALTEFMIQRKYQQLQPIVSKSNPLNSYFLFGPSFSFGKRIVVNADLQGGLFLNDPGGLSIRQQGVDRALYSFEGGQKKIFAGFGGNISIGYPIGSSCQFFINGEYLQSQSSVRLTDLQQGLDIATQQTRDMKLINISIGIRKSFGQMMEQLAGRKHLGNVKYQDRVRQEIVNDEVETGPMYHAINTKGTGATNGRMMKQEGCGPVTVKTTNPDGTVEERTFSCPLDAANYDMPAENPEEKRIIHRDLAARNIISGRLTWVSPSDNGVGIITNNNIITTDRQTPNSSFGEKVKIGIRETASGKDRAFKKYGIILADQGSAYTSNLASVNDNPLYRSSAVTDNPLYEDHGLSGENPLFEGNEKHTNPLYQGNGSAGSNPMSEGKNKMSGTQNNPLYSEKGIQENGLTGINVLLIDRETGQTVSNTTTSANGDFFFANVPDGEYVVKLSGAIIREKGYDLTAKTKIDLLGKIQHGDQQLQLLLNTGGTGEGMEQRTGVSTSRSNIRTRSISLIEADLDGDGQYESTRVMMELSDGTVQDVTASARINSASSVKKVTVRGWDVGKKQVATDNAQNEYTISVDAAGKVSLVNQEANGTVKDLAVLTTISRQRNVSQVVVVVDGSDEADPGVLDDQKIKTKSNIKNDRLMNNGNSQPGNDIGEPIVLDDQKIKTKSNIKNDRMMSHSDHYTPQGISGYSKILNQSIGDIDGDGTAETLVGGAMPGGAILSGAMMRPGQPIGGIVVKGGKNPGGSLRTVQTNDNGEFEFNKLEAGNYIIMVEQKIVIEDETVVILESNASARKGWDGTVKGGSIATDAPSERKGWDGTVKGGSIANESAAERKGWDGSVKGSGKATSEYLTALGDLDRLLAADKKSPVADIRIAKENSARLRSAIQQVDGNLENTGGIQNAMTAVDTNFAILLGSVNRLGSGYTTIGNTLKTKHDTAKNSVGNIR
ncbi:MAG TPA: SdrD B-like domain-containing protein [Chryseolinea sp.]|nr:SdrD B-like domain-containing protein [Chryseolinea sp.]